jgi:hypothetical protein
MVLRKNSLPGRISALFLAILLTGSLYAEDPCKVHKRVGKAMGLHFTDNPVTTPMVIPEDAGIKGNFHPGDCFFTISQSGTVQGYLLSTSAKGRYDYFDYSIIYSKELVVLGVVVSVYRSTHGAAICQKKWLSQFEGYRGESLKLGSDIDGVSGGTLSATSIVADMQRCYLLVSAATGHLN